MFAIIILLLLGVTTSQSPITSLIFYTSGSTSDGNMGPRVDTTSTCLVQSQVLGLTCRDTPMMISYTTSQIRNFPTIYNFSVSLPIYNVTGAKMATSWLYSQSTYGMLLAPSSVLNSLYSLEYYTGSVVANTNTTNCNDWTTNSATPFAYGGRVTSPGYPQWFRFYQIKCNLQRERMCLCTVPS